MKMCMEKNDEKPKGNSFYKVFVERQGKLFWATRNAQGEISWGEHKVEETIPESTEQGYHVWEKEKDAEEFAEAINHVEWIEGKTIVKKVSCTNHVASGLCIKKTQNEDKFIEEILNSTLVIKAQAFSFRNIKVI